MKAYNILKLNNDSEYDFLVVICAMNSAYDYLDKISKELAKDNFASKILIDQILHTGNTQKRFMVFKFKEDKLVNGEYVSIKKDSIYRKNSCEYFQKCNFLESSILTSIQRRMIQKGIAI